MIKDKNSNAGTAGGMTRRNFMAAAGGGALVSMAGGIMPDSVKAATAETTSLRWGFVGTGSIAGWMAQMIGPAQGATLAAVSSRRMQTAQEFADEHGVALAFDSWQEMIASQSVDAIYVATPTSVREEISVAAANAGKHVLAEKPFASLPSLRRITEACRANGVGFMDGTHFVHHPRTQAIRDAMRDRVGWPWSLDSAFQFNLADKGNIRYNPDLEPMGAIGDAGWYNMRAAVEYLSPGIAIESVSGFLRRDEDTGAAISGSGVILFDDGSTTTWNCGFNSGAVVMDLRLSGADGVISVDDFLSQKPDGSADYLCRKGGFGPSTVRETVTVASAKAGPTLMFEDFTGMVRDKAMFERSVEASERTQRLLDAIWLAARNSE